MMNFTLTNGYPLPYPSDVRAADVDRIADEAAGNTLSVEAVIEHYRTHDSCIAATMRALGYPGRGTLTAWGSADAILTS